MNYEEKNEEGGTYQLKKKKTYQKMQYVDLV